MAEVAGGECATTKFQAQYLVTIAGAGRERTYTLTNPAGTADLMYQGDQPWMCQQFAADAAASPCALDPEHRNYVDVDHGGADLADSAFLEPLPANPVMPTGW